MSSIVFGIRVSGSSAIEQAQPGAVRDPIVTTPIAGGSTRIQRE